MTDISTEPLGTLDPDVFAFNVKWLDSVLNDRTITQKADRLSIIRRTWYGIEQAFEAILTNLDGELTIADSISAGLAATTNGQYFRVPQGEDASPSVIWYKNDNGTAVAIATQPGQSSIDQVLGLIQSISGDNEIDIAFTDKNGLVGWSYKISDDSFGTVNNRLSNTGVTTKEFSIESTDSEKPFIIVDSLGLCVFGSSSAGSSSGTLVEDSVITNSVQSENSIVDFWTFVNKDTMTSGKLANVALSIQGTPVEWPTAITLYGASSWLNLPYVETAAYTMKVVFQLPYIAVANLSTARGIVYSFDNATDQGPRIHIQKDANGYMLFAFKLEQGFPTTGVRLPPEFKAGDWVCLYHVVSRANTGDNYQCLFLGNTYNKHVEADYTTNTLSGAPLHVGATGITYSAGYNYAYCRMNIAEVAYYNAPISENQLRNSFASTCNRMSNLGINIKGY